MRIRLQSMENLTRITVPTYQTDPEMPPSPHFDDETTLLTARPVVPIIRRVSLGNGRDYILTAAILLIAALVGAVAALSIDRFQNTRRLEASAANQASLPVTEPMADTGTSETTEAHAWPAESPETTEATTNAWPETKATKIVETTVPRQTEVKASTKKSPVREKVVAKRPLRAETPPRIDAGVRRALDSGQSRPRHAGRISEIFEGPGRY